MFDLTGLTEAWKKLVADHGPRAEEENFTTKLSRIGVKAPYGTPPAKEQLAEALAKAQPANGGSGNFMGQPLDASGVNPQAVKAQLVVGSNMPYPKADFLVDKFHQ